MLHYDDSAHPLVRMTITGSRTQDIKACMDRIAALLDAGTRFVLVVEDRSAGQRPFGWPSPLALPWAIEHWGRLKRICSGVAVVVDADRLIETPRAARSLFPPLPVPVSVFDDTEMADDWVRVVASHGPDAAHAKVGRQATATVASHPADADVGC